MKLLSKISLAAITLAAIMGLSSCEQKKTLKLFSWTYYTPTDVVAAFEKEFTDMNRSLMCRELKGALTGAPLRSCRGCVTDAAEILERMCSED